MIDFAFDINFWTVLGATIVWFVIGAIWYSPALFSKQWIALTGHQMGGDKKGSIAQVMIISFIFSLIEAYILAHFVALGQAMTFIEGAQIGLWLGLGFVAMPFAIDFIYAGKPWKLYFINVGYQLLGVVIMAGILAQWS
jgi:hypothetical protein